jgi:hypothetical protein
MRLTGEKTRLGRAGCIAPVSQVNGRPSDACAIYALSLQTRIRLDPGRPV